MSSSGIDTLVFKPHSTWTAPTSKANQCSVFISQIMSAASWALDSTFQKFYNKEIVCQTQANVDSFDKAIL